MSLRHPVWLKGLRVEFFKLFKRTSQGFGYDPGNPSESPASTLAIPENQGNIS